MADFCGICDQELGGEPISELLCQHFVHTRCLFEEVDNHAATIHYNPHHFVCWTCDAPLFQIREHEQQENTVTEQNAREEEGNRVRTLYDTNEKMRNLVKRYISSCRDINVPRRNFLKLVRRKQEDLNSATEPLLAQLKRIHQEKKQEVLNSQEYKTFRSVEKKCLNYQSQLRRLYRFNRESYWQLAEKRGCRRLKRYRGFNYYYRFRRILRVRLYLI